MKKYLPDLLLVAGAAAIAYGAWAAWPPLGFIAAGAFVLVAGLRLA